VPARRPSLTSHYTIGDIPGAPFQIAESVLAICCVLRSVRARIIIALVVFSDPPAVGILQGFDCLFAMLLPDGIQLRGSEFLG
jgi:hypothetical protein